MPERIKVATIITRMAAGAGGVALRGALALDRERYDITFLTGGTGLGGERGGSADEVVTGAAAVKDAPEGDLLAEAFDAGLGVTRIANLVPRLSPRLDRAALRTLTSLLRDGGYDVVHTHSAKAGALGRLAADRAGVARIVHTYHGFPFHDFQPAWRRRGYIEVERWLGRRTHAFLAVGSGVAAEMTRLRLGAPEQIRTIPPAVESGRRPAGPAARGHARRRLGLPTGIRLVGTVGRIDYQKAPEDWVDALALVGADDVWGVWIGAGPMRSALLARAAKRGLADRLVVLGHRDDVADLLPAFDVFALASRYEGLPCALIEAIDAGVPVVATAVNAVPDVVIPGETGLLVPPGRPALLARAMAHMLDHPGEAARMAAAARKHISDRYTPEALGAVLDHTYRGRTQWT
jgi:glycosyltransferase involved in cell wall biosynthesis